MLQSLSLSPDHLAVAGGLLLPQQHSCESSRSAGVRECHDMRLRGERALVLAEVDKWEIDVLVCVFVCVFSTRC